MKAVKLAVIGLAVLLLLVGWVGESLIIQVPVGQVGVRTQQLALLGSKGVVPEDAGPGWHRNFWFMDRWDLFDSTVQTFAMNRKNGNMFTLKSQDGYTLALDVTVKYRIQPGKAYLVRQNLGRGDLYKNVFENLARDVCRSAFGTMRTEAFYQPERREKETQKAKEALQARLLQEDANIEVIDILIRDIRFDEQYERKIKDKKLADQDVEVNRSKALAAEQAGRTRKVLAETEAMVMEIQQKLQAQLTRMRAATHRRVEKIVADAARFRTEKRADADAYAAKKKADGDLLIQQAEAQGEHLRNQALRGEGAEVLVALEAARNLKLGPVTFSSLRWDMLDIDEVVTKLGAPPR